MTITPPPAALHTPPTPLHGPLYDSPSNHSLRKSSRLSRQSISDRTPSPGAAGASFDSEGPGELKRTPKSKRARAQYSPPPSPIDADEMVATTRAGAKKHAESQGLAPYQSSTLLSLGLPTPVKTPRKKPLHTNAGAAARILFPGQQRENVEEQSTPSKRNKRIKKHVGFSLDENLENGNGQIEIYTDSKDRVPEKDEREDNPFYVKEGTGKKPSNKRKRAPVIEKQLERGLEELDNDQGMIYVFRGRKVFKRFDGPNPATKERRSGSQSPLGPYSTTAAQQMQAEMDAADDSTSHGHFTRSSIKPRRLFNPEPEESRHHHGTTTDEEALTDIEDPEAHGLPAKSESRKGKAPVRQAAIVEEVSRSFEAPASPFDNWPRRKPSRQISGTKREGDSLQSGPKRARESQL